jgi:hypothetical protein
MSKWAEWKENLGDSRPWHALDPNRHVERESTAQYRLELCNSCDQLNKITNQCKMCLCYMPVKTMLAQSECPLNKWGKEKSNQNEAEQ